jgi:general secretion pathway protein C
MTGLSLSTWPAELTTYFERVTASRWTPIAATLLALALLSHSLAQWSWRALTPPERASLPPAVTASPPQNTNATLLRDVLAANLFGVVAMKSGSYSPDNLPITSLNLVLTGVMVRGKGSYALIRIDGGDETPISIGQEVQAGARLHAVYADRAVLERGGSYEGLPLKDMIPALPPGAIVGGKSSFTSGAGVTANGKQFRVNRESLQQQMQRPDFLSQALIVPNSGGGFLVREVQPGSIYEKLGVHVGDVIRSINGQSVNSIEDVMKLYQEMGGLDQAGQITLDISRAGHTEQLQYDLN